MLKPQFTHQITFLHAHDLYKTRKFYEEILQLPLARDQSTCLIFLVAESAYLGFCEHIEPIKPGRKVILTLVCDNVDAWYKQLLEKGVSIIGPPEANPRYHIYHFFLKDPNGYWIEIQRFDQPL